MTRQSLSTRVLDVLEWNQILDELHRRCETIPGQQRVSAMCPLTPAESSLQIGKISELKELISREESPDFGGISDIEPHLELAAKGGILKIEDLFRIRSFIIASNRMRAYLQKNRDELPLLREELGLMDPLARIGDIIITSLTDTAEINLERYPALRRLRDRIFGIKQEIEKKLHDIIYAPAMAQVLQEKMFTSRNERYVLLVKAAQRSRLDGTVHDVSASGATLYIEPESIKEPNNRLIMSELELQVETHRILKKLSEAVGAASEELRNNQHLLSYLDLLQASARFSIDTKGSAPEIAEEPVIELHGARHPLLALMTPETVVGNDITLGRDYTCLIISGANTGGKTVLLKTIGLASLMAMHGLHLSAGPDSRIGIFSSILADIGDEQSLARSLSTYSGQIVIINEMLQAADSGTLLLIDEIVVGTNPRQGAALAQAILEDLITSGAKIVVATHYAELKELASTDGRFQNASVSFDRETLRPTYRLTIGIPGVSYAIEIAKSYGIADRIIGRSAELLDSREISTEALIEKMQQYEQEISEERERIARLREELGQKKERYEKELRRLEQREEELKIERGIAFLEELKQKREEVAGRIRSLQQADIRKAGELQEELAAMEGDITDKIRESSVKSLPEGYRPFDPEEADSEDVFILSLGKTGRVESVDRSDRSVQVLLGNAIKSRFPFEDVYMLPGGKGRKPKRERKKEAAGVVSGAKMIPLTVQTQYNTIDLRGKRVDEALSSMDAELDRMVRSGIPSAVIIHGHGTGALKEAVRENLKYSSYVSDYRPGEQGEGGDGVTVVVLRE